MKEYYHILAISQKGNNWLSDIQLQVDRQLQALNIEESQIIYYNESTATQFNTSDGPKLCLALDLLDEQTSLKQRKMLRKVLSQNIPILPVYDCSNTDLVPTYLNLPSEIQHINAFKWQTPESNEHIASETLELLKLTAHDRKIFISYCREDGSGYADQLFTALSKHGFQVFKDDYSIGYGVDFQEKLFNKLDDCAFLLLIETKKSVSSSWVQKELNYALKNHYGIAVIRFPYELNVQTDTTGKAENVVRIKAEQSEILQVKEDGAHINIFTDAKLEELTRFVKKAHAIGLDLRKKYIFNSILEKCDDVDQNYKLQRSWDLILTEFELDQPVYVGVSFRPPSPLELFHLEKSMDEHKIAFGILVHDSTSMMEEQLDLNYWSMRGNKVDLVSLEEMIHQIGRYKP